MHPLRLALFLFVFLAQVSFAQVNLSETSRPDAWRPYGTIKTIFSTNGTAYVGGGFWAFESPFTNSVHVQFSDIATIDLQSGAPGKWLADIGGFPIVQVAAIAATPTSLFVGGTFQDAAGLPRNDLAQFDPAGNLTPLQFEPCCDGINTFTGIDSIAVGSDRLYLVGAFSKIGGVQRNRLAAIRLPGGELLPWNPGPDGTPGTIPAMPNYEYSTVALVDDHRIAIGGSFPDVGRRSQSALAMVDAETGDALPWDPQITAADGNERVNSIVVSDGVMFVGGKFDSAMGLARTNLAAFNLTTGELTDWSPNTFPGEIRHLLIVSNVIFLGGNFFEVNGAPRTNLAAVSKSTGELLDWAPKVPLPVTALAYAENSLLVGGSGGFAIFPPKTWSRLLVMEKTATALRLFMMGTEDKTYELQASPDLTTWTTEFTGSLPNGIREFTLDAVASRQFLRLRAR